MKKIISLVLALVTILSMFSSCSTNKNKSPSETEHVHFFKDATCQAPRTCGCGATEGDKLDNHDNVNGKCSMCGFDYFDHLVSLLQGNSYTEVDLNCTHNNAYGVVISNDQITKEDVVMYYNPSSDTIVLQWTKNIGNISIDHIETYLTRESIKNNLHNFVILDMSYGKETVCKGKVSGKGLHKDNNENTIYLNYEISSCEGENVRTVKQGTGYRLFEYFDKKLLPLIVLPVLEKSELDLTVADYGFDKWKPAK